jgi:tRNA(Ile)-lysidine synthase
MPPFSTPSDPKTLQATVEQTLATHSMLVPGDRVLVGVSGGPDSMALLHLLDRMAPKLKINVGVAHLNHCLRGASAQKDADLVQQAATTLARPCHMGRANVFKVKRHLGLSVEMAARRVRYAFFKKVMADQDYQKLALGHHMDDNAEQILMALARGTGPRGLAGIAPVRDRRIIRPLINVSRSQIEAYVQSEGITCVSDASNEDTRFMRNRIRKQLLPMLAASYNPRIKEHLNQLACVMRMEETWLEGVVAKQYEKMLMDREHGRITLSLDRLRQSHPALARRLVRMALRNLTGTLQRIGYDHILAVCRLLTGNGGEKACHLPGGIRVVRSGKQLILLLVGGRSRRIDDASIQLHATIYARVDKLFPAEIAVESMGFGLRFSPCRARDLPRWAKADRNWAYFDLERITPPLTVRSAVRGDRFTPLGSPGSQKLKKFFIDQKIPREDRPRIPVLADSRGIVWLIGQRIDDRVKVTSETSQILGVEFFLLDTR